MFSARGTTAGVSVGAAVVSYAIAVVIKAEMTVKAVFLIKIQITNKFYLFEIWLNVCS